MKTRIFLAILLIVVVSAASIYAFSAWAQPALAQPTTVPTAEAELAPNTVTAEGKLIPGSSVELSFAQSGALASGGVIAQVFVQPGDTVTKDQVLASLVGIETAQAELAAAQLEQTLAQQDLDALRRNALIRRAQAEQALLDAQKAYESKSGGWHLNKNAATDLELTLDDYVQAEEDYRDAREKLADLLDKEESNRERQDAQEDYDREQQSLAAAYADLLESVAENSQPLTTQQNELLSTMAALESARELQQRLDGHNLDPEQLAAAEARLKAATAHATAAQAALRNFELRAPMAGTILSLNQLKAGESAAPGLPVVFLANTSSWIVETKDLAEVDIARVQIGQPATIQLDAFPRELFPATVTAIDPVGREYLGDMTYKVTLTLDQPDPRFLWNMTATVTVEAE